MLNGKQMDGISVDKPLSDGTGVEVEGATAKGK